MSLPFDARLKDLVRDYPRDWLAFLHESPNVPVSVLTPDLSTVSAFADTVFRLDERILHIDFQSGADARLPRRLLLYNTLLYEQYDVPVHSVVVLLHRRADRADLTGTVSYEGRPGRGGLTFRFEVIRVWEVPIAELLQSGLGTLPLATLGRVPEEANRDEFLAGVVERLLERITSEAAAAEHKGELITSAYWLTGLRIGHQQANQLFHGVSAMMESDTYRYVLEQGRTKEAHELLLLQGSERFGEADDNVRTAVEGVTDLERLKRMSIRLLRVSTWQELLQTP